MRYFLIIQWCSIAFVSAWNLNTYDDRGLNFITENKDYDIVHVSVFYVRSFLTIRSNRNNSNYQITLIESTWPENLLALQSRVFPNDLSHSKTPSNCNGIVNTIRTAVDRANGILWLLDNGSKYCPPKLIIYDLLRGNNELHRYVFKKLRNESLKSIHLYTRETPTDAKMIDNAINPMNSLANSCALIVLHRSKYLIQYLLSENRARKLSLIIKTNFNRNRSYDLLMASEITLRNDHELLIKDYTNSLWLGNLNDVQHSLRSDRGKIDLFVEVKYLGSLLGAATALTVPIISDQDNTHYLYYYLARDGAVVRWNFRQPLKAEGHEVLYLTKSSIVQILFGAKGSVWIVYEDADEMGDHCRRILNFPAFNVPRLIH